MPTTPRCFVCDAPDLRSAERTLTYSSGDERAFRWQCGYCGVLSDGAPEVQQFYWPALAAKLTGDVFACDRDLPFGLDIHTLRTAATRLRRAAEGADEGQRAMLRAPHGKESAAAVLTSLSTVDPVPVALGVICREAEIDMVCSALTAHTDWSHERIVLVDRVAEAAWRDGVRILSRPLDGDFAAQRNALQEAAAAPFVLQLDADETIAADDGVLVPHLAGLADRAGVLSVGLPRRNVVDGVVSGLYPDIQYRLNRRDVRFSGRVHERPDLPRGWQDSFIALPFAITHALDGAHVRARSRHYDTMAPGQGRLEEEAALLSPYDG